MNSSGLTSSLYKSHAIFKAAPVNMFVIYVENIVKCASDKPKGRQIPSVFIFFSSLFGFTGHNFTSLATSQCFYEPVRRRIATGSYFH